VGPAWTGAQLPTSSVQSEGLAWKPAAAASGSTLKLVCPCHAASCRQKTAQLGHALEAAPSGVDTTEAEVEAALGHSLRTVGESFVGVKHTQVRWWPSPAPGPVSCLLSCGPDRELCAAQL
jgi:hypothetical protein